jgi:uncharacterized protein YodC (DUF2158 family)
MNTLKIGDTVRLKSGSPVMTVNALDNMGMGLECVWFDGTKRCNAYFHESTLEPCDPDPF